MTADQQHFFVDALTGSDGTGAAKSRSEVPRVFSDATAAFTPRLAKNSITAGARSSAAMTRQQPYPLPGSLVPTRPSAQQHQSTGGGQVSVSPDLPYNVWPLATGMEIAASPVPPAAIPIPPAQRRPTNVQRPNVQRPNVHGQTISQGAVYHRQQLAQPPRQFAHSPQPVQFAQPGQVVQPNQSAQLGQNAQFAQANQYGRPPGNQVPAALMAWLPPAVVAQIPAANRPPTAPVQQMGSQPAQQRPTQQFNAPPQLNLQQRRQRDQQRQAQRANKKSSSAGGIVIVLLIILLFSGLGRDILDAIFDALNK